LTLTFTGGVYNIKKPEVKKYSHVRFEASSEVRTEDEMKISRKVYVGPAGGSFIDASDIIFYVAGDGHHAAKLEEEVEFNGTIYALYGEVELKKKVSFTGAMLGDEVEVAQIASGIHEAGHYSVHFTPENLSSGTYLYVLDTGSFREVHRMVYLK